MENETYSLPEISKGKKWFVYFYYRNPGFPELPLKHAKNRIKDTGDKRPGFKSLNRIADKKERLREAKILKACYEQLLEEGYNPWKRELSIEEKAEYQVSIRIGEAFEEMRSYFKRKKPKSFTKYYSPAITSFEDWIREQKQLTYIHQILQVHGRKFIEHVEEGNTDKTRNNTLSAIRSVFTRMVEENYLKDNPFANIKIVKTASEPFRILTIPELRQLKEYCNGSWLWSALQVVLYCGIRIDEMRQLRVHMFNLDAGVLVPPGTITKNSQTKTIVIPPHMQTELVAYFDKANPNDYAFTIVGKPGPVQLGYNYLRKAWNRMKETTGIEATPYGLSPTGAILTARETKDLLLVRDQKRHKNLNTTQIYLSQYALLEDRQGKLKNINRWENEG